MDIGKILLGFAYLGFLLFALIVHIVLAAQNGRRVKYRWKTGLLVGMLLFFMAAPGLVFNFTYLDDSSIDDSMHIAFQIGMVIGVLIHVMKIGWNMLLFIVADIEWRKAGSGWMLGRRADTCASARNLTGSFAAGVFIASVSMIVFSMMGIEEGDTLVALRNFFPAADSASPWIVIPVVSLTLSVYAVSEELLFRGGMLAFVIRKTGNRKVMQYLGIIALNLIWALAHIPNTDTPLVKMVQIFITGMILVAITRRIGLRNSIAAHVGLNITCVIIPYLWQWLY